MRTLEEARNTLQISQEDIDFIIEGILRAGEPIVIIAYGSRARGEADGELWGLARDLDFLVLNVDEFRAGLKAGNEFACDVDRDGVVLYGTV